MSAEFRVILKKLRLNAGYGLREFAELIGDAASNYAGVESGQRKPWRNVDKLRKVAKWLRIEEGSKDWDLFFTAAQSKTVVPPDVSDVLEKPEVLVLLRTVGERHLSKEDLERVVKYIRKTFRSDRNDS